MKKPEDAFGHLLYDYFKGEEVREIIERNDGNLEATAGPEFYFRSYDDWLSIEKEAIRFVRGRTLDIGCGAGRHTLYLQEAGHEVVGLDKSRLALRVAKERGVQATVHMPITRASSKLGQFDTIIMMGNNFGLLSSRKRAAWMLGRFLSMTSDKGRIVATSLDPYQTEDLLHLAYHRHNLDRGRMAGQVRIRVRYRTYKGDWFDYLFVSPGEMRELIEGTGWNISTIIPSDTAMYVAILEKYL